MQNKIRKISNSIDSDMVPERIHLICERLQNMIEKREARNYLVKEEENDELKIYVETNYRNVICFDDEKFDFTVGEWIKRKIRKQILINEKTRV